MQHHFNCLPLIRNMLRMNQNELGTRISVSKFESLNILNFLKCKTKNKNNNIFSDHFFKITFAELLNELARLGSYENKYESRTAHKNYPYSLAKLAMKQP